MTRAATRQEREFKVLLPAGLPEDLYLYESLEAAYGDIPAGTRYNAIAGDTDRHVGRQLAQARANVITVAEYATLRRSRDRSAPGMTAIEK